MTAWTAFASLYDTKAGWGANERRALELAAAFAQSNCSAEAKSEASRAVILYELDKHPNFQRDQNGTMPKGRAR